jgi:DNA-directed RNA polymerase subunit M/transcription elongation factor TFIIS
MWPMFLKPRYESLELKILRALNARMELTENEKFHYSNLEKGYEGEVKFDLLAENLQEERYILNDLLLEVNGSYFQIDTLIISQAIIQLLDLKNYVGDYYLETDKLYKLPSKNECKNPVNQLKRSETLLRQLLQKHKLNYLVEASVVFVNPEFTLYHAPMDHPIILPTQLNCFIEKTNKMTSKLNEGHIKLAHLLISLHQTKNPFTGLPPYDYDQLRKGIFCSSCQSFLVSIKNNALVCEKCGGHEKIQSAVVRCVEEFKLLFPDQKVTTESIFDWCKVDIGKKRIRRILKRNYCSFGKNNNTYYK